MSSRSPYKVQIHQEDDIRSSYSYSSSDAYNSSGYSTPRTSSSRSSSSYGGYGATKHSNIATSGSNLVYNHNKVGYDDAAPTPRYTGGYSRGGY